MQYLGKQFGLAAVVFAIILGSFSVVSWAKEKECPYWEGMGGFLGVSIGCRYATFTLEDVEKYWPEIVRRVGWACTAADIDKTIAEAKVSDPDNWDNRHELCDTIQHYKEQVQVFNRIFENLKK